MSKLKGLNRQSLLKVLSIIVICSLSLTAFASCSGRQTARSTRKHRRSDREEEETKKTKETEDTGETTETELTDWTEDPTYMTGAIVPDKEPIVIYSYNDEAVRIIEDFKMLHPDFEYDFEYEIVTSGYVDYVNAVEGSLRSANSGDVDIFFAESAYVAYFTKGDDSYYVAPYTDFGIDVEAGVFEANIAPFSVDMGTRDYDGKVVGLSYQTCGGCMIYRADIAKEVFGTDDPSEISEIMGGGTGSFDKMWKAAEELKKNGYALVSGPADIYRMLDCQSSSSWNVDGGLNISAERSIYMDYAKMLIDKDYCNGTAEWTDEWYADMGGNGPREVFCFFGPSWFISFFIADWGSNLSGQYRIGQAPMDFYWGGTWVMPSLKASASDPERKAAIAEVLEWITLDSSDTGLQYRYANDLINYSGAKSTVASMEVMAKTDGSSAFLGGQNIYDYYLSAGKSAKVENIYQYDDEIGSLYRQNVYEYATGEKDLTTMLNDFSLQVYGSGYI